MCTPGSALEKRTSGLGLPAALCSAVVSRLVLGVETGALLGAECEVGADAGRRVGVDEGAREREEAFCERPPEGVPPFLDGQRYPFCSGVAAPVCVGAGWGCVLGVVPYGAEGAAGLRGRAPDRGPFRADRSECLVVHG